MSLIHAHIRALRAEAEALATVSRETETVSVGHMLMALAVAKGRAADALAHEEADLKPPREGMDAPITFNPKGKRPAE